MAGLQSRQNLFGRAHPRDARQYFLHRKFVEIGVDARDRILGDDHCIIAPPRLPRSELNTDICRDPAENDRDDPATTKLPIELGAAEGIPSALDDDDISWERVNCGGKLRTTRNAS
jgi:hypothetical protein